MQVKLFKETEVLLLKCPTEKVFFKSEFTVLGFPVHI